MVIKYQSKNKWMKIFSDAKVLSSDFRKWFLIRLIESYDLYEKLNNELKQLNFENIEKKSTFSCSEIGDFLNFYRESGIDYMSFEEYIDSEKIVFAKLYMFKKGTIDTKVSMKDTCLAVINLEPDGSTDIIWIDNLVSISPFIKLINEYNYEICNTT